MSNGGAMTIDDYLDALLDGAPIAAETVGVPALEVAASVAVERADGESPPPAPELPPAPAAVLAAPVQRTPAAAAPPVQAPAMPAVAVPPTPAAPTSQRWLRANIGRGSYALELLRVQEVLRPSPIVAMRGAAPAVLGVMNLRGRVVPVFDLGVWLGTGRVQPDERSRIVVVERNDELIGALVSAVEDVVTLGRDRVEPPLSGSDPGAIVGIARVGNVPTVLLDANALFG
jgi:purine-binding chemotaxis protein CheW